MLSPHPDTALEYWFFKINAGPVALLVDWIARRKQNENVLRVSIHSPYKRDVLFEKRAVLMRDGQNFLSTERTVGELGEVAWELDIDPGPEWIAPDVFPARLLRLADLVLVSAPLATFSGWVRHGSTRVELQGSPGLVSHYWGRQLVHEWWWVSVNQFDRADLFRTGHVAVECAVIRSGLWGLPLRMPFAYLYLRQPDSRKLIMSPPAMASVTGSPEAFEVHVRRLAAEPITLKARGRDYRDLGDSIINTLVGDLEVWEGNRLVARAEGTAALERRASRVQTQ